MSSHIPKWQRVEALLAGGHKPLKKVAWVTSTEWGEIAEEMSQYELTDPSKPSIRPNPANFKSMIIGPCLTVRNSFTEDQDLCDQANLQELGEDKKIFDFRKEMFRTG